jgi:putative N6-adenine-specific DNA methylase
MFDYQKTSQYFAQVAGSLEEDAAAELGELGATQVEAVHRGVRFSAPADVVYRVAYASRLVGKVLAPLRSFRARDPEELYERARDLRWDLLIDNRDTFSVFGNVAGELFTHSQYASLKVKDAIVDSIRDRTGARPDVDRENADVRVGLHVIEDRATLYLEATGGSLHRRGYRRAAGEAPMKETLAAAIIRFTGWTGFAPVEQAEAAPARVPLYDPVCGSGTLLAEALMHAARIPTAYLRKKHGFERFPDFNASAWKDVKRDLDSRIREVPPDLIAGSDVSQEAVESARLNLRALPGGERVSVRVADFRRLTGFESGVLVANPPYGIRLGDPEEVRELYRELGDFLKQRCKGSSAFIYVGDRDLLRAIGLRPSAKKALVTGNLDGRCCRFDIFRGRWGERAGTDAP